MYSPEKLKTRGEANNERERKQLRSSQLITPAGLTSPGYFFVHDFILEGRGDKGSNRSPFFHVVMTGSNLIIISSHV